MNIPGTLPMNPEIERLRREAAEQNRVTVAEDAEEQLERVGEDGERPQTAAEVIHQVESTSWEDIRERRIEEKHGQGFIGRVKAWLAGEHDVAVDEEGDVRRNLWSELTRRGARTIFNRRTLAGGAMLATVGFLTGGWGLPAAYAFLGGVAGRGIGEAWSAFKGKERKLREDLLRHERNQWYDMKRLSVEYNATVDPAVRADRLTQLVGRFYDASNDAISSRKRELGVELEQELTKQEKLRKNLELGGYLAGLGGGLLAAKALAAQGGLEAGHRAFGGVDTDLSGPKSLFGMEDPTGLQHKLHDVYQMNGEWHFAYGDTAEAMAAVNAGADALPAGWDTATNVGRWGHTLNSLEVPGIYGYAAAKALPILAAMRMAGWTEGGTAAREEARNEATRSSTAEHARILETIEGARPTPTTPEGGPAAAGQVVNLENLPLPPGVAPGTPQFQLDADAVPHPWQPEWRFARVANVQTIDITDPATGRVTGQRELVSVDFFRSAAELRAGQNQTSLRLTREQWEALRARAAEANPGRLVDDTMRQALERPSVRRNFEGNDGKLIRMVASPSNEALRIVITPEGWPAPGQLDPRAPYRLVTHDLQRGIAELRNERTGGAVHVDLLGLAAVMRGVVEPTGDGTGPPRTEAEAGEPAPPERIDWNAAVAEFTDRGEQPPRQQAIWLLRQNIEGRLVHGDQAGEPAPLAPGRYQIVRINRPDLIVRSMTDRSLPPAAVRIDHFAGNFVSETMRVQQIFEERAGRNDPVPDSGQIERGQTYQFQGPRDATAMPYRVLQAGRDDVLLEQVLPAPGVGAPAVRAPRIRVSYVELAERGIYT